MKQQRGFTLIELLVTIAIISVLASLAMPLAELASRRNKEQELKLALHQIRTALDAYKQATDEGRIAKSAADSGYPPSLSVLVQGIPDAKDPKGGLIYLLRRLPRDPFADDQLAAADTWGLRSYASPPDNPQPGADVFDIYSKDSGTALDGSHYRDW